jgi:intein-encoded DNA endonuclease-like protein
MSHGDIWLEAAASPQLCYILGVMLGDGFTKTFRDRNRIRYVTGIKVCDYDLATSFYNALKEIGLNPIFTMCNWRYYRENTKWRIPFQVYTYNEKFYKWFKSLSLDDIKKIVETSRECMVQFVRGIYETDGSFRDKYHIVIIYNTDLELVKLVKYFTEELGFKVSLITTDYPHRKNPKWKVAYHLQLVGGKEDRERFIQVINPVIKRCPRSRCYVVRKGHRICINV